jgi:hypothetical protein
MAPPAARAARALARRLLSSAAPAEGAGAAPEARRLADCFPKDVVDDIYRCSFKRQTGVSLKCARPARRPRRPRRATRPRVRSARRHAPARPPTHRCRPPCGCAPQTLGLTGAPLRAPLRRYDGLWLLPH